MKCEHCGKNEVTFMYRSSVNGNVTERHLCGECAEKLGYTHQQLCAKRMKGTCHRIVLKSRYRYLHPRHNNTADGNIQAMGAVGGKYHLFRAAIEESPSPLPALVYCLRCPL